MFNEVIIILILYTVFATFFSIVAIRTTYEDSRKLSIIAAFVWWVCVIVETVKVIGG